MSFLPSNAPTTVPSEGDPKAKICIVGEAPGAFEVNAGKPFVGPAGRVLEQCLHSAGLIRGELYITNFIKHKITNIAKYYNDRTNQLTQLGLQHREELLAELAGVDANIIIPLGNAATTAILGLGKGIKIMSSRGYIYEWEGRKVLPTIHPAAAIRGQYIYRHLITTDFRKAKENSETKELVWPEVKINIPEDYEYCMNILKMLKLQPLLSVDIEVINHETSCIGFCPAPDVAYVIPLYGSPPLWTEEEEVRIWEAIADIMEDEAITKIGQNFIFDMQFLAIRNNIITKGHIEDTMIQNSICLPDFPKSLEFLVSIHCNRPSWKHMVHWKGADLVKKES